MLVCLDNAFHQGLYLTKTKAVRQLLIYILFHVNILPDRTFPLLS